MAGPGRPSRDEQGFSLTESVVALAVLGLVVASMVGGMATSIATSDIHRQQSETNAVLVSAAEYVKNAVYQPCASSYPVADSALPSSWSTVPQDPVMTTVRSWNPVALTWDLPPICHDTDGSSLFAMQKVTINVIDPGGRASASLDIIKRGP